MHKYRLVAKKGEGTFSEVLKAQCIKNGKYYAIKCMKNHFDSLDQVNNLREIQALRRLSPHPNIIKLTEVLYDQPTGRLALVFQLMDMNIYELIRGRRHYVAEEKVRGYMFQLMKAMDHMHRNGIFHRDIKPENILICDDVLKLADFGSCRGIYSKQPYTEYISTRWYRAPECLLTDGFYNYKMDMWGVGCVFFEIVSLFPLFPGTNELDQIQKIHNVIGTPPSELLARMKRRSQHMDFTFPHKEGTGIEKLIPHVSAECVELITRLLAYNPDERMSARQALRHPYFRDLRAAEMRAQALASPDEERVGTSSNPPSLPNTGGGGKPVPPPVSGGVGASSSAASATMKRSAAAKAAALPSIPGGGGTLLPKTMKGIGVEGSGYIDKENDADGAEGEVTVLPAIGNSVKPKRTLGGAASAAKNKLDALLKNVGDHGKGDDRRHHGVRSGSTMSMHKTHRKLKNYVSPYSQRKTDDAKR